mmetsp:Transcript_11358/g.21696  ORF Transcript_11358/g.21696 Transcript_11358/m.21696 type:complete len:171 (-) Transcript_11358:200-712(-)
MGEGTNPRVDNQRKALLAVLQPPPAVYVNVSKEKNLHVVRYTSCGEYYNEEKIRLQVLDGYIKEILDGYLERLMYTFKEGRDATLGSVGLPLYSFAAFVLGMLIVEHPHYFSAVAFFTLAGLFLVQLQQRVKSPSLWLRSFSFGHYLHILVFGSQVRCSQRLRPMLEPKT